MARRHRQAIVYAIVPRLWPDSTIVCIGGGPSLTPEDVDFCRGKARVIAVNDAYKLAPWADVLFGCDAKWWSWHKGAPRFAGLKYAIQEQARRWPGVQALRNMGETGLERDPSGLRTGRNSGYQAINLAVHLGARRIVLLGYDLGPAKDGKTHWFGNHPDRAPSPYGLMLRKFETIVAPLKDAGIEVLNCSRRTALTVFPRRVLSEVLG
jgi:hypothetical protein